MSICAHLWKEVESQKSAGQRQATDLADSKRDTARNNESHPTTSRVFNRPKGLRVIPLTNSLSPFAHPLPLCVKQGA